MRTYALRYLAVGAVVLMATSAYAQQQGGRGGRGGMGGRAQDPAMIIFQKPVQEEIKLTDSQKADVQKAQEKMMSSMREAFQSANNDREKMQESMKTVTEATKKDIEKVKEGLKPEQTKRLRQLEIQFAGLKAFADADVQTALKLTDKQKSEIKDVADGVAKDAQELRAAAQGDRAKMQETGKKVEALSKEGLEKVSGALTEDQKKAWTELVGEKFDKFERFPQGGGGRRPGGARPGAQPNNQ